MCIRDRRRMEHQRRQIDLQMDELKQRAEEFQQITGSMNEGLVLLDENGAILSINPAAQRLLGTDNACVGQDILTVDRDVSLSDGLRKMCIRDRAMAVMMVSGNVPNMPKLFESVRFLTTAVASEMGYAAAGLQRQALFSIALVLFLFIMLILSLIHIWAWAPFGYTESGRSSTAKRARRFYRHGAFRKRCGASAVSRWAIRQAPFTKRQKERTATSSAYKDKKHPPCSSMGDISALFWPDGRFYVDFTRGRFFILPARRIL